METPQIPQETISTEIQTELLTIETSQMITDEEISSIISNQSVIAANQSAIADNQKKQAENQLVIAKNQDVINGNLSVIAYHEEQQSQILGSIFIVLVIIFVWNVLSGAINGIFGNH